MRKVKRGEEHGLFKGGWFCKSTGYMYRMAYDGDVGKQVLIHRYLMEQKLGRKLKKDEYVDHINGIKTDNRLENLRICTKIQNERYYYGITQKDVDTVIDRLKKGKTYKEAMMGTKIRGLATVMRLKKNYVETI
jgi:hypothetical protein